MTSARGTRTALVIAAIAAITHGCNDERNGSAAGTSAPAATVLASGGELVVTVDVYSGRVNPTWVATSAEREEVTALVEALPVAEFADIPAPPLGFRGFVLDGLTIDGDARGRVVVRRDVVVVEHPGGDRQLLHDESGTLLELLIRRSLAEVGRVQDRGLVSLLETELEGD